VGRNRLRTPGQPQGCGFDSRALRQSAHVPAKPVPDAIGDGHRFADKEHAPLNDPLQVGPAARAVS